jgi:hypothetical protein
MPLRESFKPHADVVELIDLVQNRFKAHGSPWVHRSLKTLRCGKIQMDWLRSEDLKEEKGVTTSLSL